MPMSRIWNVDDANAALPRITEMVESVRTAAARLREHAETVATRAPGNGHGGEHPQTADEIAVIDRLAGEGIVLRDAGRGLVDFAAESPSGRPYWLCWVVGEPEVGWWHWPEDGFAGRTPIRDLPR